MARFGAAPWIDQVAFAVQNAVQNGIENLSGSSVSVNAHPDDGYRFRARTKEELIASQELVANSGGVAAGRKAMDPAANQLGAPPVDENGNLIAKTPGRVPVPTPPKAQAPKGWIL